MGEQDWSWDSATAAETTKREFLAFDRLTRRGNWATEAARKGIDPATLRVKHQHHCQSVRIGRPCNCQPVLS